VAPMIRPPVTTPVIQCARHVRDGLWLDTRTDGITTGHNGRRRRIGDGL
jgi:hypothetical protein